MEHDVVLEVTASITDVCLYPSYLITASSVSAETKVVISMEDVYVTERMTVWPGEEQLPRQVRRNHPISCQVHLGWNG